ncbi:MAG: hypothetical protein WKF78_04990 [Candidatus Limnocylindrales bacterium]
MIAAGDLPSDWPATYLPPREWKRRLVAARTLELTWESEAPDAVAMASGSRGSGDLFGWREPTLPLGRASRLADAVAAWREDRARVVLASDQAPRLADLLEQAGHAVAVVESIVEPPPPGAIALVGRSLNGGLVGGRMAWSSSRTASCSGASASGGPRRCAGSCRATCSSD